MPERVQVSGNVKEVTNREVPKFNINVTTCSKNDLEAFKVSKVSKVVSGVNIKTKDVTAVTTVSKNNHSNHSKIVHENVIPSQCPVAPNESIKVHQDWGRTINVCVCVWL